MVSWVPSVVSECPKLLHLYSKNTLRLVALLLAVLSARASSIRTPEAVGNPVPVVPPVGEISQVETKEDSQVAGNLGHAVQSNVEQSSVNSPVQFVQPAIEQANADSQLVESPVQPVKPNVVTGNAVQQQAEAVNEVSQIDAELPENPVEPEQSKAQQITKVAPEAKTPEVSVESNADQVPVRFQAKQSQVSNEVVQDVKEVVQQQAQEAPKLSNLVASEVESKSQQSQAAPAVESQKRVQSEVQETLADVAKPSIDTEQVVGKLEGIEKQVVDKVQPERRKYPRGFYIVDPLAGLNITGLNITNNPTFGHFMKPAFLPFPPLFGSFISKGDASDTADLNNATFNINGTDLFGNKHDKFSLNHNSFNASLIPHGNLSFYGKPAFFPYPLLPIPFWKSAEENEANSNNKASGINDQLYNFNPFYPMYDPSDFYANQRRAHEGNAHLPQQEHVNQGLQLIGHIYIYKAPKAGNNPKPPVPPASDAIPDNTEEGDVKIDELFGNSQLWLQPVVHPGTGNKDDASNQINEIYRSLHLVHPSVQQRSQSAVQSEDSSVLFAVEIPKPIYRFFKSIFGVFTY